MNAIRQARGLLLVLGSVLPGSVLPGIAHADAADIAAGARLYAEHCAACHGANLEGQPDWQSPHPDGTLPAPPHDDTGHTWHHGDRLLFDYVSAGGKAALEVRGVTGFQSAMPGFGEILDDDQILSILAFIKSRWSPRAQEYQRQVTDAE